MSVWFQDVYASVWKCALEEKVALVNLSTSRKNQDKTEYINSSWGDYVRFIGKARTKADELAKAVTANGVNEDGRTRQPVRIQLLKGTFSKESYRDSEGTTKYPKNPTMTVFDFVFSEPPAQQAEAQVPEEVEDDEMPF